MVERFKEIEKDLLAKTALAESLTRQLADADREAARCTELHQQEREAYQERLNELGQMAESVPILQFEIAKLQQVTKALRFFQLLNCFFINSLANRFALFSFSSAFFPTVHCDTVSL